MTTSVQILEGEALFDRFPGKDTGEGHGNEEEPLSDGESANPISERIALIEPPMFIGDQNIPIDERDHRHDDADEGRSPFTQVLPGANERENQRTADNDDVE